MNDFSRLYPGKENKLFSSVTLKNEEIIKYASLKLRKIRDQDTRTKIANIIALIDGKKFFSNISSYKPSQN